ncbi:MAG: pitrilysin family protein, partial [Cyanobacteria bacterium J06639_18]
TVQIWYKVGSRNEEPGVNGITHQLEHMMFKGTKNRPIQFGKLFSALGSDSNAFTSYDLTAYYSTAERDKLEALLILEADRMQNALMSEESLASEKKVVISELQGYENDPEYRLERSVMQQVFPNHPYGLPVGGTEADVEKFTIEQIQNYYHQYYSPNNAVLVVAGDFDTPEVLSRVKEIYSKIPQCVNQDYLELNSENQETSTVRSKNFISENSGVLPKKILLREPGATGLLKVVYPLVDINHPDVPALDVLDYILTEGRNSRLEQRLIETGIATDLESTVVNLIDTGWYELLTTADPEEDLSKIDFLLTDTIAKLAEHAVTPQELKRAKAQLEAAIILDNRDITSQAMQLANDEMVAGDYNYMDEYLEAIKRVSATDVQLVTQKYFQQTQRIVGFFEPTQTQLQNRSTGKHNTHKSTKLTEQFSHQKVVEFADVAKYLPPLNSVNIPLASQLPEEFTLKNGLKVLLLADNSTPTITLAGYIKAGSEFDPENISGLASLVAENLVNGTKTKDALTIAKILDDNGASLDFQAFREGVQIQGDSLANDSDVLLRTLGDILKNPIFPQKELQLSFQQALVGLKQECDEPDEVAKKTFIQAIYPKQHPLHAFPTVESLQQIQQKNVIEFKQKYYRPDRTILVIVGNFVPEKMRSLIISELGDWEAEGQAPTVEYPDISAPQKIIYLNPIVPGKTQSITYIGNTTIKRQDPQYYAAIVLNQILGGDTLSSRLGTEIRDRQGLTYGIYSSFLARKNFGTFLIEMQTNPENARDAIAKTIQVLEEIHQKGVTQKELGTAKRNLIGNYNVSLANPEELAHRILKNEIYDLDKEELRIYIEKINAVNLTEVNQAAQNLIQPDKIVIVTAGPEIIED